jgi:hypothetical protein
MFLGLEPESAIMRTAMAVIRELLIVFLPQPSTGLFSLAHALPGLNTSAAALHDDVNFLSDLRLTWSSTLFRIGHEVVAQATKQSSRETLRTVQGFFDWEQYQQQMVEDVFCHNLLMRPTGALRQLYMDTVALDYELAARVGTENHPIHGDMHLCSPSKL